MKIPNIFKRKPPVDRSNDISNLSVADIVSNERFKRTQEEAEDLRREQERFKKKQDAVAPLHAAVKELEQVYIAKIEGDPVQFSYDVDGAYICFGRYRFALSPYSGKKYQYRLRKEYQRDRNRTIGGHYWSSYESSEFFGDDLKLVIQEVVKRLVEREDIKPT